MRGGVASNTAIALVYSHSKTISISVGQIYLFNILTCIYNFPIFLLPTTSLHIDFLTDAIISVRAVYTIVSPLSVKMSPAPNLVLNSSCQSDIVVQFVLMCLPEGDKVRNISFKIIHSDCEMPFRLEDTLHTVWLCVHICVVWIHNLSITSN